MDIQLLGGAGRVTGSCYLVRVAGQQVLLDCGLIQGLAKDEQGNRDAFPFDPAAIDAVVLSHAHIDHSGRLPLLVRAGFRGPIYTHRACRDLCRIMLKDAAYLNERDAEWENRKRARRELPPLEPLYTLDDARAALRQFKGLAYGKRQRIGPGLRLCLHDAGHILGSAIVELELSENGVARKLVFSGDLGQTGAPILEDPAVIREADLVLMESTYGDRLHRSLQQTWQEIGEIIESARSGKGNVLIPAFAVGRTQDLLYLFARNFDAWSLDRWQIVLDSPMAIAATEVYYRHNELYDAEARRLWNRDQRKTVLPNLSLSQTTNQSMRVNRISSGAIIISASGMCTGGRIRHHLKHNIWRRGCHLIFVGYQATGTLGRAIVDGAREIKLWGETIKVRANVHTVGGLSAHADQAGLTSWYEHFVNRPPLVLVHGEPDSSDALAKHLRERLQAPVSVGAPGQRIPLG
ncbi:MAG: MBL fold metallo-hydrolase [Gammaproteobacteria bacterium]|nr:MBL fold metallo-hydrolase [Gammaproteobacteria bacterium]